MKPSGSPGQPTQPDFLQLRQTETAAPALGRGLALWVLLIRESPLSLEEMAGRLDLPKASALRLLGSLCRLGMIQRLPDKRYEPLWGLRSLVDPRTRLREKIAARLDLLSQATQSTTEWYEPEPEGMVLVLQQHPKREVRVQIRPGYCRGWLHELEAIVTLGLALAPGAPAVTTAQSYVENGVKGTIRRAEIEKLLAHARKAKTAAETFFNSNGVRRSAVALMNGNRLLGVLSVAEVFRFHETREPGHWLPLLLENLPR